MSLENIKKTYSILERDNIKNDIEKLEYNQQCQVFNIIKKHTDKISENSNGIFINLKYLKDSVLDELSDFINYCKNNTDLQKLNELTNNSIENNSKLNDNLSEEYNNYNFESSPNSDFIFKNYIDKISTHNIKEFDIKTEEKKPLSKSSKIPLNLIENRIMKKCREINKFNMDNSENFMEDLDHLNELKFEL
uniref:NET domain-containing protein n=1 Tax=viral metagenome TaxID=1070528 RepID=A0A6C0J0D7_9ZZZZ